MYKQTSFFFDEDVLQLMAPNFKIKLENWLFDFEDFRKSNLKKIDFNSLPKSGIKVGKKDLESKS